MERTFRSVSSAVGQLMANFNGQVWKFQFKWTVNAVESLRNGKETGGIGRIPPRDAAESKTGRRNLQKSSKTTESSTKLHENWPCNGCKWPKQAKIFQNLQESTRNDQDLVEIRSKLAIKWLKMAKSLQESTKNDEEFDETRPKLELKWLKMAENRPESSRIVQNWPQNVWKWSNIFEDLRGSSRIYKERRRVQRNSSKIGAKMTENGQESSRIFIKRPQNQIKCPRILNNLEESGRIWKNLAKILQKSCRNVKERAKKMMKIGRNGVRNGHQQSKNGCEMKPRWSRDETESEAAGRRSTKSTYSKSKVKVVTWRADLLSSSRRNSMDLARLASSLRLCGESISAESNRPVCWLCGCPDAEQPRLSMLLKRFDSQGECDASAAADWCAACGPPPSALALASAQWAAQWAALPVALL